MNTFIIDLEADNLLDKATKIHCLSFHHIETKESKTLVDYEDIKKFILQEDITIIGHNIILYDCRLLEKILEIDLKKLKKIDTLGISWYLDPLRKKHGLEIYGTELGVSKPKVTDWSEQPIEVYIERCQEDVKINTLLWEKQYKYLKELYITDSAINRFITYINFKLDCVKEQEEIGLKLDIEKCKNTLSTFESLKEDKIRELESCMPQIPIKTYKTYKFCIEDDFGNIHIPGSTIFDELSIDKPIEENKKVEIIKGYKAPNANSHIQLKDWLYSLGWKPKHIKHVRDKKKNEVKQIPQIGSINGQGEICDSIKKLFSKEPSLELLDGLSVLSHRISILKGFLKDQKDGRLYASMNGFTNTLRLKHSVLVNLPTPNKRYAEAIRECIIADKGSILCGSDLSGIEDNTKRHYIYKYDPEYVKTMFIPGYDAHLELGILANLITEEEKDFYKAFDKDNHTVEEKKRYININERRALSKTCNFAATYKSGAETLSRNSGMTVTEAKKLLKIYWERNKAILQIEDDCIVKEVQGQKWLQNPLNKFWYSLRTEKDRFSTLNQSSAVYVFDLWISYIRKQNIKVLYQCHDECLLNCTLDKQEEVKEKINEAMKSVNNLLKLNVTISCNTQFSQNYSECH